MRCPDCHAEVPASLIACPACTSRRSHRALLARETHYLPGVRDGSRQLRLARASRQHKLSHVEFLFMAGQSYCGEPLSGAAKREYVSYKPGLENFVCTRCWKTLQEMLSESKQPAGT